MKKLLKNNQGFSHVEILVVLAVVIVVSLAGFVVWQRSENNSKEAEAETSAQAEVSNPYIIWQTSEYQVRACRPESKKNTAYNGITAYVLANNNSARNKFKKFIVRFTNTVNPSKTFAQGGGLAQVKVYKNPYGVNSRMAATVLRDDNSQVRPRSVDVINIKLCPK